MYPAWSPDGQYIAFLRANDHSIHPRVFVMPVMGGPARVISDFEADGRNKWTPDGRFILAGSEGLGQKERGVMAIPVAGGTATPDPAGGRARSCVRPRALAGSLTAGLRRVRSTGKLLRVGDRLALRRLCLQRRSCACERGAPAHLAADAACGDAVARRSRLDA